MLSLVLLAWSAGGANADVVQDEAADDVAAEAVSGEAGEELPPVATNGDSPHVYKWFNLRGAAWISSLQGEVNDFGVSDFNLDDFQPGANVSATLRLGKHDLLARFRYYANDGGDSGVFMGAPVTVDSDFDLTTLDIRYAYSFWTIEEDGFRFGPGLGISVIFPNFEFREATTGFRTDFDTTVPAPTIRLRGEVPIWRDILFDADVGAFYLPPIGSQDFEGFVFEIESNFVWRPFEHFGFFAGVSWFHIDAEDKANVDFNFDLVGPQFGAEFRF